jgi:hypothetical protein
LASKACDLPGIHANGLASAVEFCRCNPACFFRAGSTNGLRSRSIEAFEELIGNLCLLGHGQCYLALDIVHVVLSAFSAANQTSTT